ncbi:unnamed protein product [Chondrus crispus]|uniref:Uncharacterized protein n=1 Tax=Chondrus crispus TaxID=2769 RepID=R7Q738_CHOCR|nr:unnamed protein product [Chondrus crispus]CDF33839.1 unnamed protein product [Chondrus crispus]|eukprot:XP_005713658.1 unnamed protein product [Chondrus crispus]
MNFSPPPFFESFAPLNSVDHAHKPPHCSSNNYILTRY